MNFLNLLILSLKKNLKNVREIEDLDERRKQWLKIVFGMVLALGYGVFIYLQA